MKYLYALPLLFAASVAAQIATPARPVTDPHSLVSPADPLAAPVPIDDLVFTRGALDASWSADGRQLFVSTNLTGRYNIWRMDAAGSWPVQLTQAEDNQAGFAVSPDGRTLYYTQDKGGNEQYDIYAVPTAGGAPHDLDQYARHPGVGAADRPRRACHRTVDQAQGGRTEQPRGDGRRDRDSTPLTREADPKWNWSAVAWTDGGRRLIANRSVVDGSGGGGVEYRRRHGQGDQAARQA